MKRKILSAGIILICLFMFSGCGGNRTTPENNTENNSNINDINIEDVDWFVKEGLIEKERAVVFGYTNNTGYPLLEVEMKFEQKKNLTDEDLAVIKKIKKETQWTDEDMSRMYLIGYTKKIVDPGETAEISPCSVNGYYSLYDIAIYNLMEPSAISVYYIDSDKIKNVYYDFKLKQYAQSYDETDAQAWTDNSEFSVLPKCEARVIRVNYDYETSFSATAYGMTKDDFKKYIQACKDNGLSNVERESDTSYDAESNDGYKVFLDYVPSDSIMSIDLSAPKKEQTAAPAPTVAPTPAPAPTAPPAAAKPAGENKDAEGVKDETSTGKSSVDADFKAALDEYETFFNDYVDFIKKYKNSNGTDLSLISDYASYISKYSDMMTKLDELGKKDMTADETAYFLEVQARITKKLAEIAE